jgi:PGAP1-like protein
VTGPEVLEVRGGIGGIRARTDDMERAAHVLGTSGAHLAGLGLRLGAVAAAPDLLLTVAVSPATSAAAEAAVLGAAFGPDGLVPAAARLEFLGVRLRAAAIACAATDEAAVLLAQAVPVAAVGSLGLAAVGAVPWAELAGTSGGVGSQLAGVVEVAVAVVPGSVRRVAGGIGAVTSGTPLLRDGHAVVTARPPTPVAAPSGVADLLRGVASCYPEGGAAPGTVRVLRVLHPDGRRAWIVEIPGTQGWTPLAGDDPFDLSGDVASMSGGGTAAGEAVEGALAASGARRGEPVLLAGHSLGGMVAAGLAADPAFRSRFTVTHVLTAGSPVAGYPVPRDLQVLSLEHTDDVVPALDGRRDPDRSRWVTVRRTLRPVGLVVDPEGAHDIGAYTRTAALVDASEDPSVAAWRAGLTPFLTGAGVSATAVVAVGARVRR